MTDSYYSFPSKTETMGYAFCIGCFRVSRKFASFSLKTSLVKLMEKNIYRNEDIRKL